MERTGDLPVAVDIRGVMGTEVTAFVEGEAAWQVVGDGPPRPRLALRDEVRPGPPCVIVVDGRPDGEQVRAAMLDGAVDVVAWPDERTRLLGVPGRLAGATSVTMRTPALRIVGGAGGVGTTTVALGLAFLAARGGSALVIGSDDTTRAAGLGQWRGPGAPDLVGLDPGDVRDEVTALARAVPGCVGLAVLGGGAAPLMAGPRASLRVVIDAGRDLSDATVVVARPDGRLPALADHDVPVLINGSGPLDRAGVAEVLGRVPIGWLPDDPRVARAHAVGRVPADLPGSWMAALRAVAGRWAP